MSFRPGQWVKFIGNGKCFEDAHRAKDGKIVGIYRKAFMGDQNTRAFPDHIVVVTPTGENLMVTVHGHTFPVQMHPGQPGLVPITDRDDIPLKRIEGLLKENPDWQPQA